MNNILVSTLKNLNKAKQIISILNDELLCNATIPPYRSSIGSHIRHILDFYDCILNRTSEVHIDLTLRRRNVLVETNCTEALKYHKDITNKLINITYNFEDEIFVIDDLGNGKIKIKYTLGALFAQANSHTIHHYAIINYIMNGLEVEFKDTSFGYNPTTPNKILIG
ncbi:MAG TPA: DinB family protein [Yeosuana sp.]